VNFALYFVWAGAEIAVAMVCLGVPTLRPLYLKQRGMTIGDSERANTHATDPELPIFTMCEQKPAAPKPQEATQVEETEEAEEAPGKSHHHSPEPTSFLRDSSSSRTMVESSPSPEPYPTRPESAYTRDRSDSVDDILGLYNSDRSRSRGTNKTGDADCDRPPSTVWFKADRQMDMEAQDGGWPLRA